MPHDNRQFTSNVGHISIAYVIEFQLIADILRFNSLSIVRIQFIFTYRTTYVKLWHSLPHSFLCYLLLTGHSFLV